VECGADRKIDPRSLANRIAVGKDTRPCGNARLTHERRECPWNVAEG
jgi:hypothetical protein